MISHLIPERRISASQVELDGRPNSRRQRGRHGAIICYVILQSAGQMLGLLNRSSKEPHRIPNLLRNLVADVHSSFDFAAFIRPSH